MLLNRTESRCRGCYVQLWPPAPSESPPSRFQSPAIRKVDPSDVSVIAVQRSEEHTSELQSLAYLVCRLLLETKNLYDQHPDRLLNPPFALPATCNPLVFAPPGDHPLDLSTTGDPPASYYTND